MGLFGGGKPDHPLADPREARRVLEALPDDNVKAVDELRHWLESVTAAEGFRPEVRIQLLLAVDDAAQPRLRKLAKEYFGATRPTRFQENRLWTVLHGYWRQVGLSYARAIDLFVQNVKGVDAAKALLGTLLTRTLRSLAQQTKWLHMRYGPADLAAWGVFNNVYAFAESRKLAQARGALYTGASEQSSPQQEFLRGAMFEVSAPDGLLPLEADLAERLIAEFAGRFEIGTQPAAGLVFGVDLAQAATPARLSRKLQPGPGLRCFGAGSALAEMQALADRVMTAGQVPSDLNLGGSYEPEVVLEVLRHLALYWAPQAPERKAPRHPVKSRLAVAHGYNGVVGVLGGDNSLDFDNQNSESWIVENVSAGGFGAVVPQVKGDWLRVGALLALQPEGGTNWLLGVVRRVNKTDKQQARVGIQTLSKTPLLSQFAVSGAKGAEAGVLLKNGDASEAHIVLRPGVFAPAQNLELPRGSRHHVFIPQVVSERGEDYEIARFREMVRDA